MKVFFFGRLADAIGRELEVEMPVGSSIGQLRERLIADHPDAEQPLRSIRSRACVDDVLVPETFLLAVADRVEFLPPVSGG